METSSLELVVEHLEKALKVLSSVGIEDERLMSRYVEYRVALELSKRGHKVQLLNERSDKSADIYIPDTKIRVEVKSGKFVYGFCCASFGRGSQIKEGKFDYCVFIPYDKSYRIKEFLIFKRSELTEVAEKPHEKCVRFRYTNPCVLFRCDNYEDLKSIFNYYGEQPLEIEEELHKHPEKFKDAWDKIVQSSRSETN
jgi:hypothetical protein